MIKSREEKKASHNFRFRLLTNKKGAWLVCRYQFCNSAVNVWNVAADLREVNDCNFIEMFLPKPFIGAIPHPAFLLGNILKDDIRPKSLPRKSTKLKASVKICKSNICSKLFLWTLWEAKYSYNNIVKSCSSMAPNILRRRKTIKIVKRIKSFREVGSSFLFYPSPNISLTLYWERMKNTMFTEKPQSWL